uniref:Glycine N-acyltransferase N-terminal domain-containing protein n=2 Tax=Clastoptera arizonana TaxID=38151 RepID=A0A1B6E9F1_9HEMI
MFHCIYESKLDTFKRMLRETEVIDWTQKISIKISNKELVPVMASIAEENKVHCYAAEYYQVWLPPEKSENIEINNIPADLELRDLEEQHTDIVNKTWANRGPDTDKLIRNFIMLNGGVGLFNKGPTIPCAGPSSTTSTVSECCSL